MTRKEYIETFHEKPEDMFGSDWKNIISTLDEDSDNKFDV